MSRPNGYVVAIILLIVCNLLVLDLSQRWKALAHRAAKISEDCASELNRQQHRAPFPLHGNRIVKNF
jgi:hypothetical protein